MTNKQAPSPSRVPLGALQSLCLVVSFCSCLPDSGTRRPSESPSWFPTSSRVGANKAAGRAVVPRAKPRGARGWRGRHLLPM